MESNQKLAGIFPALVTPFDKSGHLDSERAGPLIERLIQAGVHGFYIGGSTGEGFLQSLEERKRFLKYVAETTKGRVKIIAHVGTLASHEAFYLSGCAADFGYDLISSTPPFYYAYTEDEVFSYYEELANKSSLPLLLYNAPHTTGVSLSMQTQQRLLEIPNVIGSKHTDSNMYVAEQLLSKCPGKVVMNGPDEMLTAGLAMGMQGGIGATYNLMPSYFLDIYRHVNSGKLEKARESQVKVNRVIAELIRVSPCVIAGIKSALGSLGYDVGYARKPLQQIKKDPSHLVELLTEMSSN
jgi:N-acetylneuraminate lyase